MSYLPLILVAVVLVVAFSLSRRNRQRSVTAQQEQRRQIGFGTEVMTTSGLYGTVVGVNNDDTVQLSIAPGVEVKWALAALRDVASLPNADNRGDGPDEPTDSDGPIDPHDPPRL